MLLDSSHKWAKRVLRCKEHHVRGVWALPSENSRVCQRNDSPNLRDLGLDTRLISAAWGAEGAPQAIT